MLASSVTSYAWHSSRDYLLEFMRDGSPQRILEVGCADGAFLSVLKDRYASAELWGIELNKAEGDKARKFADNLIVGDVIEELDHLPDSGFDAIFFNDVLEHIVDPYRLVERIAKKTTEDGVVIASIPNVRYWRNLYNLIFKKDWQYEDTGILDKTHLRFFTCSTAGSLFSENGYEVLQVKGINKTKKRKVLRLNKLLRGWLDDTLYLQYVIVAKPLVR